MSFLYVVATPIGNLADISERARDVLQLVDLIAAEDTRHSRQLLNHYGIQTPLISYHSHNEPKRTEQLINRMKSGKSIALISDAGTPLVSDPGFELVRRAREEALQVVPIPGPSALVAALSVAGIPADRFVFEGFLPAKGNARRLRLTELAGESRTLIFYESPHRILASLADIGAILGEGRNACVARELTKKYETIRGGRVAELRAWMKEDQNQQRGEFVVIVAGSDEVNSDQVEIDRNQVLEVLLGHLPLKQAVQIAAHLSGAKKNELYQLALQWREKGSN